MISMKSILLCALLTSWSFDQAESNILKISKRHQQSPGKCSSQTCNNTASEILKNMDPIVKPCDNFYKFACGRYKKSAITPNGGLKVGEKKHIEENPVELAIKSLEDISQPKEPRPLKLTKTFFKSCMNRTANNGNSVNSLKNIIRRIGGWPVLEGNNWNESSFHWTNMTNALQQNGFRVQNMPRIFVSLDGTDWTKRAIYVGFVPWLDEFKPAADLTTRDTARTNMVNIAVKLGANREFAEKEFKELFKFVLILHQGNLTNDQTSLVMKFKNLPQKFPAINWQNYIKKLVQKYSKIEDDDKVFIDSINSIFSLENIMTETPKRVQANFIVWNVISESIQFLTDDIHDEYQKLLGNGNHENEFTLNEKCFQKVFNLMPVGLSALYVRNNFNKYDKDNAVEISAKIWNEFNKTMHTSGLLNGLIKKRFVKKLQKMLFSVAWPSEFFDDSELEKLYKNLNFSSDNQLQNYLSLKLFNDRNEFSSLKKSVNDFHDWKSLNIINSYLYSLENNAYYLRPQNTIVIPASHLTGLFHRNGNPKSIKFASTGFSIAHEMYHALDIFGRGVDENGKEVEWDESSEDIFREMDGCFFRQYKNSSFAGTNQDEGVYLEGNSANDRGLRIAYSAYLDWLKGSELELQLHGLDYNPKQMFWISYANNWCEMQRDPNLIRTQDKHIQNEFRVVGPLSNMPEFAEDFNCPLGSAMNPEKKCSAW